MGHICEQETETFFVRRQLACALSHLAFQYENYYFRRNINLSQTTRWDLSWDLSWEHPSPSPGWAFPGYVNGEYPLGFGNLSLLWSRSPFMEVGPGPAQLFPDLFFLRSCGVFSLLLRFFKRSDFYKTLSYKNCLKTF